MGLLHLFINFLFTTLLAKITFTWIAMVEPVLDGHLPVAAIAIHSVTIVRVKIKPLHLMTFTASWHHLLGLLHLLLLLRLCVLLLHWHLLLHWLGAWHRTLSYIRLLHRLLHRLLLHWHHSPLRHSLCSLCLSIRIHSSILIIGWLLWLCSILLHHGLWLILTHSHWLLRHHSRLLHPHSCHRWLSSPHRWHTSSYTWLLPRTFKTSENWCTVSLRLSSSLSLLSKRCCCWCLALCNVGGILVYRSALDRFSLWCLAVIHLFDLIYFINNLYFNS